MSTSIPLDANERYRITIGAVTEAQLHRAVECASRYPLVVEASYETLKGSVVGKGSDLLAWSRYFDQVDLLARNWNPPVLPA